MNILRKWLLHKKGVKLPFTKPPLRAPGETLGFKFDDELLNFAMFAVALPVVVILFGIFKVLFVSSKLSLEINIGIQLSVIIPILVGVSIYGRKKVRLIRNYYIGYTGERVIGQQLERARKLGYSVFHDIEDKKKKFNVDHIAIGKAGIIVVETKAKSKPEKGSPEIHYNGENLLFPDGSYTSDPLKQVDANAKWVQELAHQLISDKKNPKCNFKKKNPVPVVKIVAYPGWCIKFEEAIKKKAEIKVTNDTMIADPLIKNLKSNPKLTPEMVTELQELLGAYLQEENKWRIE